MLSNLWSNTGTYNHALTVSGKNTAHVLLEGNVFDNVPHPYEVDPKNQGYLYAQTSNSNACQATFGRDCFANTFLTGSKPFTSGDSGIIGDFKAEPLVKPVRMDRVEHYVKKNAGFGTI